MNGRILMYQQPDNLANTIEGCISTCIAGGYSIAGVEYGVQCFCSDFIHNGGTVTDLAECSFQCSGNSEELCGASDRMSLYSIGTPIVTPP
jgi:hypothetical protein